MVFNASVFRVLIATPSDLTEERDVIERCILQWTTKNAHHDGIVLLPIRWENSYSPTMSAAPQDALNAQFAHHCDMVIGSFWTRMGTPTRNYEGGAEEEIDWYISNNKPTMIYFSDKLVAPSQFVYEQHEKLEAYKKKLFKKGLCGTYSTLDQLEIKLGNHLDISMRNTKVVPKVDTQAIKKELQQGARSGSPVVKPPSSRSKLYLKRHTDRSFIVCGPCMLSETELTALGGQYISLGRDKWAWNFGNKRLEQVAEALHIDAQLRT